MGTRKNHPELTSREAADLLEVHPSTIKRWCDDGGVPSSRTEGGHRRIELKAALDLAGQKGKRTILDSFSPWEANVWSALRAVEANGDFGRLHHLALGWLQRGEVGLLGQLFLRVGKRPGISFPLFLDHGLRGFMTEVGEAWRAGRLGVGEEHMATQIMEEVLIRLRPGWNSDPASRSAARAGERLAVVGGIEGDHHALGAQGVRAILEQAGWLVYFLGPNVPAADFAEIQRAQGASLVCISFSGGRSIVDLQQTVTSLGSLYQPGYPYHLVIGGAATPFDRRDLPRSPFESVSHFDSAEAFSNWLATISFVDSSEEEWAA